MTNTNTSTDTQVKLLPVNATWLKDIPATGGVAVLVIRKSGEPVKRTLFKVLRDDVRTARRYCAFDAMRYIEQNCEKLIELSANEDAQFWIAVFGLPVVRVLTKAQRAARRP